MTPLAQAIFNDRFQRKAKRVFQDQAAIADKLEGDWLCFEASQIAEPGKKLAEELAEKGIKPPHLKLPAPKTWIEFVDPDTGLRVGYLLTERADGYVELAVAAKGGDIFSSILIGAISRSDTDYFICPKSLSTDGEQTFFFAFAMVYMINSPQWFGHRQHSAHAGLARKLRASGHQKGKFPYLGWTEIVLELPSTARQEDNQSMPTGRRVCRHAVRGHWLTFKNGRPPVWQPYHMRGDVALGLKQSRYQVVNRP